jgi:hypothetical protein
MKAWVFLLAEGQCVFAGEMGGLWKWFWERTPRKRAVVFSKGRAADLVSEEEKMSGQVLRGKASEWGLRFVF